MQYLLIKKNQSTSVAPILADTQASLTSISFDFYLMGTRHTQFSASDNGVIGLSATPGTSTYALPNSTTATIAAFANDMRVGTDGVVRSKVVGTAPNRCLVVEWSKNMIRYISTAAAGTATWQVRLYETTGVIEYVYGSMATNTATPAAYYVGFSTNTTVNNVVTVNTTAHTASTSATVTSNAYTASSTITNLNSAADGSRRVYKFTPLTPTAAPIALNFTAVTASATTLNWTDNASNETGYAIYRSTDNITFTYVTKTAANIATYAATGLTPSTTYYWQVYAVTEGGVSSALAGSQATSAAQTYYWQPTTGTTNNWSTASNWNTVANGSGSQRTTPDAIDVLVFSNGGSSTAITSAAVTQTVAQIVVSNNTAITLKPAATFALALTIGGGTGTDLDVQSGSTLAIDATNVAASIAHAALSNNTATIAGTLTVVTGTGTGTYNTGTLATTCVTSVTGALTSTAGTVTSAAATLTFANASTCNVSGTSTLTVL